MISFKEWLKTMDYHAFIKSREGRFVNDVLQDDDFPLVNLSIYIDTAEFNATIPDDLLSVVPDG